MIKEIGSNFWLNLNDMRNEPKQFSPEIFGCSGSDYAWMSTGRSAISFVLDEIEKRNRGIERNVVIPPFTCSSVIEPFYKKGYNINTVSIDENLSFNPNEILRVVAETSSSLVFLQSYFGCNTLFNIESIIHELRNMGVLIIEDCTHNLYSSYQRLSADYYVASIRKWCGVPDGGFAVCREGRFDNKPTEFDEKLQEVRKVASLMKYKYIFDGEGEKGPFLDLYREAGDILDNQSQYYCMCPLSFSIQSHIDINDLKRRRRHNFQLLLNGLKDVRGVKPLFNKIQDDEVPLYYPLLCDNRSHIQQLLSQHAIYAPILWPKADRCPEVNAYCDYLYKHLLCIPIDQRYGADDMQRIIDVLHESMSDIRTGWLTWEEILPFKEQLIDFELDLMITYHYPEWNIPRSYPEGSVNRLQAHIQSGNTFFWAAIKNDKLVGYYWGYISNFIDKKRWNTRSIYFTPDVKGLGLGQKAITDAHEMALSLGCDQIATEYVPTNEVMANLMKKNDYKITRIEVVKALKSNEQ